MKCYSVILASGTGRRLPNADNLPKQFLSIVNESILSLTVKQFIKSELFDSHIILVCQDWYDHTKEELKNLLKDHSNVHIAVGDSDRQGSLLKGLYYIKDHFETNDNDIIVSHDGVRPFIFKETIIEHLRILKEEALVDGVNTVIACTDTMIFSKDGKTINNMPNRNELFRGQTPQSFRLKTILEALSDLSVQERLKLTDAISALLLKKKNVKMVKGSNINIKITTPEELVLAKALYAYMIERIDGTYYI